MKESEARDGGNTRKRSWDITKSQKREMISLSLTLH